MRRIYIFLLSFLGVFIFILNTNAGLLDDLNDSKKELKAYDKGSNYITIIDGYINSKNDKTYFEKVNKKLSTYEGAFEGKVGEKYDLIRLILKYIKISVQYKIYLLDQNNVDGLIDDFFNVSSNEPNNSRSIENTNQTNTNQTNTNQINTNQSNTNQSNNEQSNNKEESESTISAGSISTPSVNNGKVSFESSFIKVDALGNVQVKEGGERKYFFPMCIYHDNSREDRSFYAKGGRFNCIIAWDAAFISKAKKAGLKSILQLDQYQDGGELSGQLGSELQKIKNEGLQSDLLFLYTDNEGGNRYDDAFPRHKEKKQLANTYDKDPKTGKRAHPMYYLNGVTGDSLRQDNNGEVSDITGSYVYERWGSERENGPEKIIALETNGTKQPVVMAQLNFGVGGPAPAEPIRRKMTPIAMASVAAGARGLGYWRDRGSTGEGVEDHGFRDDLPKFRKDINKMMSNGLLEQSQNEFGVDCSGGQQVFGGTRKLNGIGYLIVSNWNDTDINTTCNVKDLGYSINGVTDFLNGGNGGNVSGNSVSLNIPAYSRKVVKLNK